MALLQFVTRALKAAPSPSRTLMRDAPNDYSQPKADTLVRHL